ncbi:hypothetical protein [Chamaesiphon sp. VAR_48_metabat_403]|uniref:hypothetical protein n=1 Tax=Chamaesiphon sp. VAR_48_metabat_403 TaxID=2964700 RepID=UPI00286DDD70|nr:hypothetical protein [Chamaesiphon sp. VAR_48_metabat_403]
MMNRIKIAMLLVVSIGCWYPISARAEAPTPKGGCWSRDIAARPTMTDSQTISTTTGTVIAIENNNKDRSLAAKEVITWVRLKMPTGEQKTAYLGSSRALKQQRIALKVNDTIEVRGIQTAKSQPSPTIIASTIKKGNRTWKLDNPAEKPIGTQWCKHNG